MERNFRTAGIFVCRCSKRSLLQRRRGTMKWWMRRSFLLGENGDLLIRHALRSCHLLRWRRLGLVRTWREKWRSSAQTSKSAQTKAPLSKGSSRGAGEGIDPVKNFSSSKKTASRARRSRSRRSRFWLKSLRSSPQTFDFAHFAKQK